MLKSWFSPWIFHNLLWICFLSSNLILKIIYHVILNTTWSLIFSKSTRIDRMKRSFYFSRTQRKVIFKFFRKNAFDVIKKYGNRRSLTSYKFWKLHRSENKSNILVSSILLNIAILQYIFKMRTRNFFIWNLRIWPLAYRNFEVVRILNLRVTF